MTGADIKDVSKRSGGDGIRIHGYSSTQDLQVGKWGEEGGRGVEGITMLDG